MLATLRNAFTAPRTSRVDTHLLFLKIANYICAYSLPRIHHLFKILCPPPQLNTILQCLTIHIIYHLVPCLFTDHSIPFLTRYLPLSKTFFHFPGNHSPIAATPTDYCICVRVGGTHYMCMESWHLLQPSVGHTSYIHRRSRTYLL